MSNILRKITLILLSIFFLLSSIHIIDLINYQLVVNFFGLNHDAQVSNVIYIFIIGFIFILSLVISMFFELVGNKNSNISNVSKKISESLGKYLNNAKNNVIKTIAGLILVLILKMFFLKMGLFECTKSYSNGGLIESCGTEKELIFLTIAMILFVFAITPKNIGEKIG